MRPDDDRWREIILEWWPWTKELFLASWNDVSPSELAYEVDIWSIWGADSDLYKQKYVQNIW